MIANVVVLVNTSMSAAASTPVYLAMDWRSHAVGYRVEVALHPGPEVLPGLQVIRHRVN